MGKAEKEGGANQLRQEAGKGGGATPKLGKERKEGCTNQQKQEAGKGWVKAKAGAFELNSSARGKGARSGLANSKRQKEGKGEEGTAAQQGLPLDSGLPPWNFGLAPSALLKLGLAP
jgi:hypothetical protein